MNTYSFESERIPVSLEAVWRALTALGHQQLWLRPPEDHGVNTWLIVTWDGLTAAERILVSGSWWLTGVPAPSTPILRGLFRAICKNSHGSQCSGE
ncbi:TPA: hypothetical protein NO555_002330 [Klebsiella variicola subsp. variicola]|nr:hypothetical protein [Klebsiella variicola subsp. variicola]HCI4624104.1 hypothetical protein [Klebsiella variicola subsp. variicola]HCI6658110.1 hypothetical protein [Klebsiella variicola subsp. variicola]